MISRVFLAEEEFAQSNLPGYFGTEAKIAWPSVRELAQADMCALAPHADAPGQNADRHLSGPLPIAGVVMHFIPAWCAGAASHRCLCSYL